MNNISRRDFLKLGGAMLGAMALPEGVWALGEKPPWLREEITVGNLKLTPIVVEHDRDEWELVGGEVSEILVKHDFIINEYIFNEYKNEVADSSDLTKAVVNFFDQENLAFLKIEELAMQNNIPIVSADPAHSLDTAKMLTVNALQGPGVTAAVIKFVADDVVRNSNEKLIEVGKKDGRRMEALKLLATNAAPIVAAAKMAIISVGEETDLRRVVVAKGLKLLSETVDPGTHAAIVYPPGHWDGQLDGPEITKNGIKYYLDNPEEREARFNEYISRFSPEDYPHFYKIRGYSAKNGEWEKTMEMSIN